MSRSAVLAAGWSLVGCGRDGAGAVVRRSLSYAPPPADNPMKGFVPFAGDRGDAFPHSMEWAYFPLNAIMTGPGRFDFDRVFHASLAEIAGRGHQAALRIYLDYPQRPSGVPQILIDNGLRLTPYREHGGGQSPDYGNDELVQALVDFISAFGERYDGDPRIGYLTLGLLGHWGEWHTWPRSEFMAPEAVRRKILEAYATAFSRTPLLMRYPLPDAMDWPVGLHDDSFAHSTIGQEEWKLLPRIQAAGAEDLWKTRPIGGEVRPEVQPHLWKSAEPLPEDLGMQDYGECVRLTRASWMICDHLFHRQLPEPEYSRAIAGARLLGYELHLAAMERPEVLRGGTEAMIAIEIENRGVAPLYAPWTPEILLVDAGGRELAVASFDGTLNTILPGERAPQRREARLAIPESAPLKNAKLVLRPPRAFSGSKPLRFANAETHPGDGSIEWALGGQA
ncbi:MAG: DUF4832 domain-containing protein [Verrucomicrobiae bacterium]|nr:DUF4832 domain-containing protein [Verrucomicrobiae bacterium]